jgi:hypothetical protein
VIVDALGRPPVLPIEPLFHHGPFLGTRNHNKIFPLGGVAVEKYRYYDPATRGLNFQGACIQLLQSSTTGSWIVSNMDLTFLRELCFDSCLYWYSL